MIHGLLNCVIHLDLCTIRLLAVQLHVVLIQPLHGFRIGHPMERPAHRLQLRGIPFENGQLTLTVLQCLLDDVLHEVLGQIHIVVQVEVGHLRL